MATEKSDLKKRGQIELLLCWCVLFVVFCRSPPARGERRGGRSVAHFYCSPRWRVGPRATSLPTVATSVPATIPELLSVFIYFVCVLFAFIVFELLFVECNEKKMKKNDMCELYFTYKNRMKKK